MYFAGGTDRYLVVFCDFSGCFCVRLRGSAAFFCPLPARHTDASSLLATLMQAAALIACARRH